MALSQNDFEKINRYINGESDEREISYVESLFISGEENPYLRHALEKDWENSLKSTIPLDINLNHLLDSVHHQIRKRDSEKRNMPSNKFMRYYMQAAAILLLPILVAGGLVLSALFNNENILGEKVNNTIYAPLGARISFSLPDGTTGMLNSGSRLSYALPFNKDRHLKLEGEAWFEVKHDKEHPFEINANNSLVKVIGTSFNISTYQSENYIEVILRDGKVEFTDQKGKEKVSIFPTERMIFKDGKISKSFVDPSKYSAWTEGKLVFRGDPMYEVARRIERWYNVKINIKDKELEKYSFRATFQDDSLEDVLRFLCLTSPIKYKISPRLLMSDGTYKKEEVTIYKITK